MTRETERKMTLVDFRNLWGMRKDLPFGLGNETLGRKRVTSASDRKYVENGEPKGHGGEPGFIQGKEGEAMVLRRAIKRL